jgi:hypothetical protein
MTTLRKYCLDPVLDLDTEPELFQSWNRNRSKSVRFHNTGCKCGSGCATLVLLALLILPQCVAEP